MANVIDGRMAARKLDQQTKVAIGAMVAAGTPRPGLAVIHMGNDPASELYVRRKIRSCEEVGICCFEYRLPAETTEQSLLSLIAQLNADPVVHGILCQVPLPPHIDAGSVLRSIAPEKDVDGFHPVNVGRLSSGAGGIIPCTPLAVMRLIETVIDDFVGKDAVVIGTSNIVGKPVALLLLERECTVTIAHASTQNLREITRRTDIVVAAAGEPELVKGDWVKPGAVVIDVGITRILDDDGKKKLLGDVAFAEVQHAKAVTPVPGGVGPMSIACLLHNTVRAARALNKGAAHRHDPYHDAPDRSLIYQTMKAGLAERVLSSVDGPCAARDKLS